MRRAMMFWDLLPLVAAVLAAVVSPVTGQQGTCLSQGSKFPRFSLEGKPPRKSIRGPDDLSLCRIYRSKTCCTAAQTNQALVSLRKLASNGEGNSECIALWEVLECSICDSRVGVLPGPPLLCHEFCESLYEACTDAFFAMDPSVLMPCGPKDIVCAQAKQWTSNSTHFCQLAGFRVQQLYGSEPTFCFDGKAEIESSSFSGSTSSGRDSSERENKNFSKISGRRIFHKLRRWLMTENVLWAIGGLVLTAGAAFFRQRGIRSKQKRAALFRTIQEARYRQQAALLKASKKF